MFEELSIYYGLKCNLDKTLVWWLGVRKYEDWHLIFWDKRENVLSWVSSFMKMKLLFLCLILRGEKDSFKEILNIWNMFYFSLIGNQVVLIIVALSKLLFLLCLTLIDVKSCKVVQAFANILFWKSTVAQVKKHCNLSKYI